MKAIRTGTGIKHILPRIREILERIYGDRLVDIILYGSFARNTQTKDSDIDIAVVLKGSVHKTKEIDRAGNALYELMLETNELISVHPLSDDELNNSVWPLYYHIKVEGIKL